jgi:WD40 repeat protein
LKDPTTGEEILVSGGTDLSVKLCRPDTLELISSIVVEGIPRSVDISKYLLVGMRNGSIAEYDIQKNAKEVIMHSHHDGEVWGLCVMEGESKFFTSGDDNKVYMFDIKTRKCLQKGHVVPIEDGKEEVKAKPAAAKKVRGGASTLSSEPAEK